MDIEREINIYGIWIILNKRKWWFLAAFALIMSAIAAYLRAAIPLYMAVAKVRYEPPAVSIVGTDLGRWDQWVALNTQVEIINSHDMAERLRRKTGMDDLPSVGAVYIKDSHLIRITCVSQNPELAVDTLQAAIDIYIEMDRERWSRSDIQALEDITSRTQQVEESLTELEERKRQFLEDYPMMGLEYSLGQAYIETELRQKELLKRFTPEHPEVVSLNQRLDVLKARLAAMPSRSLDLDRLAREIEVSKQLYLTLSKQQEEKRIALASTPTLVTVLARPTLPTAPFSPDKRKVWTLGFVAAFFGGCFVVMIIENLDISITTLEDIESLVGVPVLGVVPHFGGKGVLGRLKSLLPGQKRKPISAYRAMLVIHPQTRPDTIEVYHSLRSSIQSRKPELSKWALAFTSTGMGEGKTLTAINFCLSSARAGLRTLLVGVDVRRSMLHHVFGIPKHMGLIDILSDRATWQEAVSGVEDLFLGEIPMEQLLKFSGIGHFQFISGQAPADVDVVSILSSQKLADVVAELRENFDMIVFDCPPVLLFADTMVVAPYTDGVVLIYQAGKLARQALKRAKQQLEAGRATILGVVLNDMRHPEPGSYYGYYPDANQK